MGNHTERHDRPRSCRDALSNKCYRIHKTGQNKKRRHKTRTRDLWSTRRETQIQTNLDQPPRKNGHHQTAEILPHLQTPGKKGSRTPQETMATRRWRNRSNDLIHEGRWWWWWYVYNWAIVICTFLPAVFLTKNHRTCCTCNMRGKNGLRTLFLVSKADRLEGLVLRKTS